MEVVKIFKGLGEDVAASADVVSAIKKAVKVLNEGGVVMHATDTCYGLAANVFSPDALERLYSIKKMDRSKPVSMMIPDVNEALKFAEFGGVALNLANEFWPGPLTLILKRKDSLPSFFNGGEVSVGVRCPDSRLSLALIYGVGSPLTTTSANVTGNLEVYNVKDFLVQFGEGDLLPDLIIDSGEISKNIPSTIVSFDEKGPVIIRKGSLSEKIKSFI